MKRLIPLLFVLLPYMVQAQESAGWSKNVVHITYPQKLISTQDGGYFIWGTRQNSGISPNYYIKYNAQGEFLWYQNDKHRYGIAWSSFPSGLNEMNNGNLWLSGSAHEINGPESTFIQELNPLTGDTLYTKYLPDSLHLQEIRYNGTANRIYGSSLRDPNCVDCSYYALVEYDENLKYIRDLASVWGDFNFPNIMSDDLYVNTFYKHTLYMNLFENRPAAYVRGNTYEETHYMLDYHIVGKFPSGDLLLNGLGKIATYRTSTSTLTPYSNSFFGLNDKETIDGALASASGDFIVHGVYDSSPSTQVPFLMKVDLNGNQIWKHYYPEETNYKLHSMVSAKDGGVVMLVHQNAFVKLVKANAQGYILNAEEEISPVTSAVTLFPNPTNGNQVNLTFPKSFSGTLQMFDPTGKLLLEKTFSRANQFTLGLPESILPGIHHLRLTDEKGSAQALRFLKQ